MGKDIVMSEVEDIHYFYQTFGKELMEYVDLLGFDWYLMTQLEGFEGETADSVKAYISGTHGVLCKEIKGLLYELDQQYARLQMEFSTNVDGDPSAFIREECVGQVRERSSLQRKAVEKVDSYLLDTLKRISDIFSGQPPADDDLCNAFETGEKTADTLLQNLYDFDSANSNRFDDLQTRIDTMRGMIDSINAAVKGSGDAVFFEWGLDNDLQQQVAANVASVPAYDINGVPYTESAPQEPFLAFDEDFPYDPDYQMSAGDYAKYLEWQIKLEGAEFLDYLPDGTAAYRNYLFGNGQDLTVDYEKAYRQDEVIQQQVDAKLDEGIMAAVAHYNNTGSASYSLSGGPTTVPNGATENWQKAIGGHQVWNSMDVQVEGNIMTVEITVHALDRYNFNSGAADIATGTPDNINGIFQRAGLANSFTTRGSLTRTVTIDLSQTGGQAPSVNDPNVGVSEGPRAQVGEGDNR